MEATGHPSGYYYSLILYLYGIPEFDGGPNGTHTAIFSATDNFQGACVWSQDSVPETSMGWNGWTLRTDQPEAIHDHNFDLYTRSVTESPGRFLPYAFTNEYASWGTWYEGKYQGDSSFGFSVPKDKNGNPFTPYTAGVSAVMDHSMTVAYAKNGKVLTFNGVLGKSTYGNIQDCFKKADGGIFEFGINYVGIGDKTYLCYDGHPGYDYPFVKKTPIHAATAGTLCVATNKTTYSGSLWRDPAHCPFSQAGSTNWKDYHTFYIIHEGLIFNGSVDSYMTVYLHSNNLEPSIEDAIRNNGYVMVTDGAYVADVGGYGPSGPDTYGYHLHFEAYKWNASTTNWDRVDPYGDGVNNILWRH